MEHEWQSRILRFGVLRFVYESVRIIFVLRHNQSELTLKFTLRLL